MANGNGRTGTRKARANGKKADTYQHKTADSPMRPEVGTQAQFKKRMAPKKYRYDDSLAPSLEWDGQNPARERGEALIREAMDAASLETAKSAVAKLKAMSKPFLNWAGKAERVSFDVPTLPLFIHERLSTKAILETLKGHKRDRQTDMFDLFGDPQHSITDQVLKAYEHRDRWTNRMILGDSLVVMNSLLRYENLGGQIQMIYIDPPYGVSFGSNFQPFVRDRSVQHNDDDDMSREPETVQAYRDTWDLGLHSYLTYLRDRLLLARDLLKNSGSVFVQISDDNLHHVRELMDEVFGVDNFKGLICFSKTTGLESVQRLPTELDYLLWYGKEGELTTYQPLFELKDPFEAGFTQLELEDATRRRLTREERRGEAPLPEKSRLFMLDNLTKPGPGAKYDFEFEGKTYTSGKRWWGMPKESLAKLVPLRRLAPSGDTLRYVRYFNDFPFSRVTNLWQGFGGAADPIYVVQTNSDIVERCVLMTTAPGDVVLDPTCGSGTTAYVAEQWGRRWITIDTSRVPLALARQRLLTSTFKWYSLADELSGPVGGFIYRRRQNRKGDEVGGIVPHITPSSLANNEQADEEVFVDRPEAESQITRVTGPFTVEATIPTPLDWEETESKGSTDETAPTYGSFVDRMLEILRKSPVLRLEGNKTVNLKNIRPPAKTLSLSAEAVVPNGTEKPVAFVFGPENGAVSERLVTEAAKEASLKSYSHLYVIGFAIQPNARQLVEHCDEVAGIPATYIQATPDVMMGDLLKNMRSSQIFSVCGLPEAEVRRVKPKDKSEPQQYEVELLGLDVFDPVSMEVQHRAAEDVPAWLLDTDYNGLCFHVSQAFFPRTSAWDAMKKALKGEYEDTVWDHLAGTTSAPFEAGEHGQVAIKVIDDRGNELLIVKKLSEAKK